jgi:hypothetical protein
VSELGVVGQEHVTLCSGEFHQLRLCLDHG